MVFVGVKRGNVTSIEGVKRGNVTSTSVSKFESSFGENATSTSLHILDLAVSVDGQVRIFRFQVFEASIVSLSAHLSLQLGFCDWQS